MALKRWTLNNQPDGTTVSVVNSDDFGDPAWGTVSITGTVGPSSLKYSTTHPPAGSTSSIKVTALAGDVALARSPVHTAASKKAIQRLIYLEAYPTVTVNIEQFRHASGSQFGINLDTTGRIYLTDNNASATQLMATTVLPLNQWIILDIWAQIGTANNNSSAKWQARKLSDLTVIDSKSSTTLNLNNAAAAPALLVSNQFPKPNSAGAVANMYIGQPAEDDGASDYITYSAAPLDFTVTASGTSGTIPSATLTLTASAITGGTGTALTYVVDWGDGTQSSGAGPAFSHTYTQAGDFAWSMNGTNT